MQVVDCRFELGRVVVQASRTAAAAGGGNKQRSTNTNIFRCSLVENPQSTVAEWYMNGGGAGTGRRPRRAAFAPKARQVVVLEFGSSSRADITHFVEILHAVIQAKQRLWDERFPTTAAAATSTENAGATTTTSL
jgi:hypothetical protein